VENLSSNFWIIPLYLLSNLSFLFNLVCTPCTPLLALPAVLLLGLIDKKYRWIKMNNAGTQILNDK